MPSFLPSLLAALCWGLMFPIADTALERVDAVHLTALRYVLASAGFVAILVLVEGRGPLKLRGRGGRVLLLGAAGFAGFNLLAFAALTHTTPARVALVVATTPLVTVLGRWLTTGERPSPALLACVAAAFSGVALVITQGDVGVLLDGGVGGGELMVLGGVVCWVAYTLGAQSFPDWSPLRFTALTAAGGTLAILAITAGLDAAGAIEPPSGADVGAIAPQLAYVVILGAVVGVVAWNHGVRLLGSADAALFMNLVPVVAFAVAAARGTAPAAAELAGAALTLASVVTANVIGRRAPRGPASQGLPAGQDAKGGRSRPAGATEARAGCPAPSGP